MACLLTEYNAAGGGADAGGCWKVFGYRPVPGAGNFTLPVSLTISGVTYNFNSFFQELPGGDNPCVDAWNNGDGEYMIIYTCNNCASGDCSCSDTSTILWQIDSCEVCDVSVQIGFDESPGSVCDGVINSTYTNLLTVPDRWIRFNYFILNGVQVDMDLYVVLDSSIVSGAVNVLAQAYRDELDAQGFGFEHIHLGFGEQIVGSDLQYHFRGNVKGTLSGLTSAAISITTSWTGTSILWNPSCIADPSIDGLDEVVHYYSAGTATPSCNDLIASVSGVCPGITYQWQQQLPGSSSWQIADGTSTNPIYTGVVHDYSYRVLINCTNDCSALSNVLTGDCDPGPTCDLDCFPLILEPDNTITANWAFSGVANVDIQIRYAVSPGGNCNQCGGWSTIASLSSTSLMTHNFLPDWAAIETATGGAIGTCFDLVVIGSGCATQVCCGYIEFPGVVNPTNHDYEICLNIPQSDIVNISINGNEVNADIEFSFPYVASPNPTGISNNTFYFTDAINTWLSNNGFAGTAEFYPGTHCNGSRDAIIRVIDTDATFDYIQTDAGSLFFTENDALSLSCPPSCNTLWANFLDSILPFGSVVNLLEQLQNTWANITTGGTWDAMDVTNPCGFNVTTATHPTPVGSIVTMNIASPGTNFGYMYTYTDRVGCTYRAYVLFSVANP